MQRILISVLAAFVLVSPVLGWPEWPFYLPGIVSLALWALVALSQIFASGTGMTTDG